MKPNSRSNVLRQLIVFALVAAGCANITAQQAPPQGSFRFANAAAVPGSVLLTIDTAKLRPEGFGPGETTGMIGILAGAHQVSASTDKAKPAQSSLAVQPNTGTTVIAYSKLGADPHTKQPLQELQLFALPDPARAKGKHFRMIYASARASAEVTLNGQPTRLNALREAGLSELARGNIKIEAAGKPVMDFTAEENGTFLIIIFDKPDGSLGGMLLPDYG